MSRQPSVICVVGARPNFMKIAPIMRELPRAGVRPILLHTGQHYDHALNQAFFDDLSIPKPDIELEVGSASHAVQTAEIMRRFEPVLDASDAGAVLVVGDVNSTVACALVAAKKCVPVIHVEAGLRSGDRTMPEEINRIVTDALSELLFVTEREAIANLTREGVAPDKIKFSGNVMIDTLLEHAAAAPDAADVLATRGAQGGDAGSAEFIVLTLHRPSNVDEPEKLAGILNALRVCAAGTPIVFPVHPRTAAQIDRFKLSRLIGAPDYIALPPVGYLEMLGLIKGAKFVATDSGGLQEETTALGTPCITLRDNTERPVTVSEGTNTIVGSDPKTIPARVAAALANGGKRGHVPELWDGMAARRIAADVASYLSRPEMAGPT